MRTFLLWWGTAKSRLYAQRARIRTIATAHTLLTAIDWPFDYVLYPTVLIVCGPFAGTALMMTLALLLNIVILQRYVADGTDWLGVQEFERLRHTLTSGDSTTKHRFTTGVFQWATQHGDTALFFFFSIFKDPFWTVAFLRKGSTKPLALRDWKIFWASFVVANLYWAGRWILTIEGAVLMYEAVIRFVTAPAH